MKIKSFILLLLCISNVAFAQKYQSKLTELQHINYATFIGKSLKVLLQNDTLKRYVKITRIRKFDDTKIDYFCIEYTKSKTRSEAVLLKVYLTQNPETQKVLANSNVPFNIELYIDLPIAHIIVYSPRNSYNKNMDKIGVDLAHDKSLFKNIDSLILHQCIGKPLSCFLENDGFSKYIYYDFSVKEWYSLRTLSFHYGYFFSITITFDENNKEKGYIYDDANQLWNVEHLKDEKMKTIKVELVAPKPMIKIFQ